MSVAILLLFQLEKWSLFALGGNENIYPIISGVIFLMLGLFIRQYLIIEKAKRVKKLTKSKLSEQELKVLHLIADGRSNKEIATKLFIAETTVKSHVSNILKKLDVKRRTEAVKVGLEHGII